MNQPSDPQQIFDRLGTIVRSLHDTLRELGAESALTDAATAFPSARERLNYIGELTEKSANTVLNKVDEISPLQEHLSQTAKRLHADWERAEKSAPDALQPLVMQTRQFMAEIQSGATQTRSNLSAIMMAQDFQDLTGQLIRKIVSILDHTEKDLLRLLIDAAPSGTLPENKKDEATSGPVTIGAGAMDQSAVDDLLEGLGF